jgi:hypothetical protein
MAHPRRFEVGLALVVAALALGCSSSSSKCEDGDDTSADCAKQAEVPGPSCDGNSLLLNCSFESPVVPVGGYQPFAPGDDLDGWTVIGAPGNVGPLSGAYVDQGLSWTAKEGAQTLNLTGTSGTATGVSQAVPTTPGRRYKLTFWIGNIVSPETGNGTTSTVDLLIDGTPVWRPYNSGGAGVTLMWMNFEHVFTAAKDSTFVGFVNADPASDNSNILDSVSVVEAP